MYRPGVFGVDPYHRDLEFAWDTLFTAKMGTSVRTTLTNFALTLDATPGISPIAPGARGIELVHNYFRREGIDWTPDVGQTPLRLGLGDISGYTAEDRGHVDVYLTVPDRLAPNDSVNYGGSAPSKWTVPDEDVSSGHAVGTTRPKNSIFIDGPPVGQELDLLGTGWAGPRTAHQTYFHHEFQHNLPPGLSGKSTELWSAGAEVVGGHFDKAGTSEFPYNFVFPEVYQARTAFMAYVAYNFPNADTTRTLAGMTDDLMYKWAKARTSPSSNLGLMATFLADAQCATCATKQYFRPGGTPLSTEDRVGVLLHNWRVAMFADNPAIEEGQFGFPAWSGFKPSVNVRAWQSFTGTLADDVDALPGVVTFTSEQLATDLSVKNVRTLHGGSRLLAVSQLGANYWVIRAGSGLTSADRKLAVRITPLTALKIASTISSSSPTGGRLNVSLIKYNHADTTAAEESILWQHPEWIAGVTPIASVELDTVTSELEVILPDFGLTTKAAVLVMSIGDGRVKKWGNEIDGFTRDAMRYRLDLGFRQASEPLVASRLFATVDSLRAAPSWAPDGTNIVFSAREPSGRARLWRQAISGGAPAAVNAQAIDQLYPDWSPRGDVIAYEGIPDPAITTQTNLYLTPVSLYPGVNPPIALTSLAGCEAFPAFQPNGQGIAYLHNGGSGWNLRWIAMDGTGDKQLASLGNSSRGVNRPRWSADGSKVYVVLGSAGDRIAWVPKDGGVPTVVADYDLPVKSFDLHPGIGPLAVATIIPLPATTPAGAQPIIVGRIALYTPESVARDTAFRMNALGYDMDSPRYSPDGTRLAMHGIRINGSPAMHWGRITENLAPNFNGAEDQFGVACVPLQFGMPATDPEGQPLTYQLFYKPSGSLLIQGNIFRWQNPVEGQYFVVFRVMDPKGAVASRVVLITITDDGSCGDPLSGGGEGGGGGLRSREVGQTRSASTTTGANSALARNSFLDGAASGAWTSQLASLPALTPDGAGEYGVSLLSQTAAGADVDRLQLIVVDHAPGTLVIGAANGVLIGNPRDIVAIRDVARPDSLLVANELRTIEAGTTLEIELVSDPTMLGIAVRCQQDGASAFGGIEVMTNRPEGWVQAGTLHPRRALDQLGCRMGVSNRVRLHFTQPVLLAEIRQVLSSADSGTVTMRQVELTAIEGGVSPATLQAADGSPLHLEPGVPCVGRFPAPEQVEGSERSFFLELVGRVGSDAEPLRSDLLREEIRADYRFALQAVQPNPTYGRSSFPFSLARDGRVDLEIFDLQGARVRTLAHGARSAGTHVIGWDGRDEGGTLLGAGTYFVRLVSGKETAMRRFVLLR